MGWLAPGRLLGNRFSIVVRNACPPGLDSGDADDTIRTAVGSVSEFGFVNYVGLQRFAKGGIRSDLVGLAYLRREYVACVDAMLNGVARHPAECAEGDSAAANRPRAHWIDVWKRTNSPSATLRAGLPASAWAERRVLMGMDAALRRKRDWATACRDAFLSLPKTIRTLYVHAYLDRLWNLTVSERVQRGGARCVVAGDVVTLDSEATCDDLEQDDCAWDAAEDRTGTEGDEASDADEASPSRCHVGGSTQEHGPAGRGEGAEVSQQARRAPVVAGRPVRVHVVTDQEAHAGSFSILDVVVPRAGEGLSPEVLATPAGRMLERYLYALFACILSFGSWHDQPCDQVDG